MRKLLLLLILLPGICLAQSITVNMLSTKDSSMSMGSIIFKDSPYGLLAIPNLNGFSEGLHGFHVHVNASCADSGNAAGGHFDVENTGKHLGPYGDGHIGDMPPLYADFDGKITLEVLAPRLKVADLSNHAIMIHQGGDNYSDSPLSLGGGGARIACAVVLSSEKAITSIN